MEGYRMSDAILPHPGNWTDWVIRVIAVKKNGCPVCGRDSWYHIVRSRDYWKECGSKRGFGISEFQGSQKYRDEVADLEQQLTSIIEGNGHLCYGCEKAKAEMVASG